ncbi:hypothetical protein SH661x_004351 [Planctomicrobium sp. SH661]|uniref:hypothetical protein n=1 Tax=Planctomicrobium sp. SH661 TaxID=3448124 RepID=UPI003F5C69E0
MNSLFLPILDEHTAVAAGFRFGAKGTHSSRTMMFDELEILLSATDSSASRDDYAATVIESNCLAKPTAASRRQTNQRIGELYALDLNVPVFRIFRRLWDVEPGGRRLLALLCSVARDPLLAATAEPILRIEPGREFMREPVTAAIRSLVGDRLNESILAKVVRNCASTWTQSGHLEGRTLKKRHRVTPSPATISFALFLGSVVGYRGADLFGSGWMSLLDCPPPRARDLALQAKRIGLIDIRISGDVIELNLDRLDPATPGS